MVSKLNKFSNSRTQRYNTVNTKAHNWTQQSVNSIQFTLSQRTFLRHSLILPSHLLLSATPLSNVLTECTSWFSELHFAAISTNIYTIIFRTVTLTSSGVRTLPSSSKRYVLHNTNLLYTELKSLSTSLVAASSINSHG